MRFCVVICALALVIQSRAADIWKPTSWLGEQAYVDSSSGWTAIVSVDRARLVYLGLQDGKFNLLYSTPTRRHPAGWGGHRVWLGPQVDWNARGWPPPTAWEKSPAGLVEVDGKRLRLSLPPAGDGWPGVIREYEWRAGTLLCTARIHGGTRPSQIIHILQVPSSARALLDAVLTPEAPRGYALLHLGRSPSPQIEFSPRAQVDDRDGKLNIRFNGSAEKIGTKPQTLTATISGYRLRVARGNASGTSAGTPDSGFVTQVYVGRKSEPIVELEQLSDLWIPGADASFDILVTPEYVAER